MSALARCKRTGNPCGTDTRPVGFPCTCDVCRAWRESEWLRYRSPVTREQYEADLAQAMAGLKDVAAITPREQKEKQNGSEESSKEVREEGLEDHHEERQTRPHQGGAQSQEVSATAAGGSGSPRAVSGGGG